MQKTAYEMRISDWSSDVCSSDLPRRVWLVAANGFLASARSREKVRTWFHKLDRARNIQDGRELLERELKRLGLQQADPAPALQKFNAATLERSEEHTSELQSLMRISYAVFCLKKKTKLKTT